MGPARCRRQRHAIQSWLLLVPVAPHRLVFIDQPLGARPDSGQPAQDRQLLVAVPGRSKRARGFSQYFLGDTSLEHPTDASAAVGPDDDEIGPPLLSDLNDSPACRSLPYQAFELDSGPVLLSLSRGRMVVLVMLHAPFEHVTYWTDARQALRNPQRASLSTTERLEVPTRWARSECEG
jgi:hypothetical protein